MKTIFDIAVILDSGCWILDAGFSANVNALIQMQDAGCWMLDSGFQVLDVGRWCLL